MKAAACLNSQQGSASCLLSPSSGFPFPNVNSDPVSRKGSSRQPPSSPVNTVTFTLSSWSNTFPASGSCSCAEVLIPHLSLPPPPQDPAGIFELVEVVGNGTYGQVYKVRLWVWWEGALSHGPLWSGQWSGDLTGAGGITGAGGPGKGGGPGKARKGIKSGGKEAARGGVFTGLYL